MRRKIFFLKFSKCSVVLSSTLSEGVDYFIIFTKIKFWRSFHKFLLIAKFHFLIILTLRIINSYASGEIEIHFTVFLNVDPTFDAGMI